MKDNPARNEFDDLVRRAKGYHVHPLTHGEKVGVLWADGELTLLREVAEAVKECAAGMKHPDGLELPPARGDWERVMAALRALDAGKEGG